MTGGPGVYNGFFDILGGQTAALMCGQHFLSHQPTPSLSRTMWLVATGTLASGTARSSSRLSCRQGVVIIRALA